MTVSSAQEILHWEASQVDQHSHHISPCCPRGDTFVTIRSPPRSREQTCCHASREATAGSRCSEESHSPETSRQDTCFVCQCKMVVGMWNSRPCPSCLPDIPKGPSSSFINFIRALIGWNVFLRARMLSWAGVNRRQKSVSVHSSHDAKFYFRAGEMWVYSRCPGRIQSIVHASELIHTELSPPGHVGSPLYPH